MRSSASRWRSTVAPPSVHASGGAYRWYVEDAVADPPGYLPGLLARPEPRTWTGRGELTPDRVAALVGVVLRAEEGNRNEAVYWAARRMAPLDGDPNPLIDAAVSIGLSRTEAERTVASAFRAVGSTV